MLPPFTDLRSVQTLVDADKLELVYGAQDVSAHTSGAYTGEISPVFLAKLGVTYVAIGHSERREYHNESDALVNAKVQVRARRGHASRSCASARTSRSARPAAHVPHTLAQLDGALADLTAEQVATIVVAYEPVWAIGTGETATPEDAQEMAAAIRGRARRAVRRGDGRRGPRALRRLGEVVERRLDHGQARRRRRARRRREPGPRGVRGDRAVPVARRRSLTSATGPGHPGRPPGPAWATVVAYRPTRRLPCTAVHRSVAGSHRRRRARPVRN